MPKTNSQLSSQNIYIDTIHENISHESASQESVSPANPRRLKSVLSELDRLSKSFVNSYQTLEDQVERLNGQLINETQLKQTAIQQNQQLLVEKAAISDRLQNLLAIMPAGVVVIDGQGKVKDCNAMAVDILGRPLLGQLWLDVINRAFCPQADDGHQVSLKDGRKIHIETKALDAEPGQIIVMTDLTKTRELQAKLSQQQKLSSMGKMVASLAHQIRTPLSTAILYGSHLSDSNLNQQMKEKFSQNLMERLHFMERQIDDMLNFMKGERKQKQLVSVKKLYKKLVGLYESYRHIVDFQCEGFQCDDFQHDITSETVILADEDSIIGALSNLIENAIEACEKTEKAQISIKFLKSENLKICISDNGKGISKNKQRKIFDPFYTDKRNGNGLGLSVVHGVVIDHFGSIQVESTVNVGTQFVLTFPLQNNAGQVTNLHPKTEKLHEV